MLHVVFEHLLHLHPIETVVLSETAIRGGRRGWPFPTAPRFRLGGDAEGARRRHAASPVRARRVDHYPAVGQEPISNYRTLGVTEGRGVRACGDGGSAPDERPHFGTVSQRDRMGARRLWC